MGEEGRSGHADANRVAGVGSHSAWRADSGVDVSLQGGIQRQSAEPDGIVDPGKARIELRPEEFSGIAVCGVETGQQVFDPLRNFSWDRRLHIGVSIAFNA